MGIFRGSHIVIQQVLFQIFLHAIVNSKFMHQGNKQYSNCRDELKVQMKAEKDMDNIVNGFRMLIATQLILCALMCKPGWSQDAKMNAKYAIIEVKMISGNMVYNIGKLNINVVFKRKAIKYFIKGKKVGSLELLSLIAQQEVFDMDTNVAILANNDVPLILVENIEFVIRKIGAKKVRMYVYDDSNNIMKEVKFISAKHHSKDVVKIIESHQ